jgi:DNA-binding transcriptional ArsR family regulator
MTAQMHRLRPKRHDAVTEALQLVLELPLELTDRTRDDLVEALGKYAPPDSWGFVMLNPDQQRMVLKAINAGPKPAITLRVWNACISRLNYGTAEIMASGQQLAEDADTTPQEVSRALSRLAEIGALVKLRKGRYAMNPHVGWAGSLVKRQEAMKDVEPVQLRLVD